MASNKKTTKKQGGSAIGGGIKAVKKALSGGKSGSSKHRSRGPSYWANKVIVAKLKRKYNKLKYAGI